MNYISKQFDELTNRELYEILKSRAEIFVVEQNINYVDMDDIVNVMSFKSRMEKMLAAPTTPYASCKEIQLKISNQKERINYLKTKNQL